MQTVSTRSLDLLHVWTDGDPAAQVHPAFPINKYTGARDTAVVVFEVEPGEYLPTHTDSAEEILYIVSGTGIAHAGDERGRVSAGDLVVNQEMVPHGVANDGDETLRVVGFFCKSEIVSTFEETLQPLGVSVVEMGAPVPA